jgi:phenylacetic acid degradation operon negative regulatory protein
VTKERNASLTARSVLLSLLLGNQPPRAPVSRLVRTAALFGIAEGTVRTALSRMAAAGELVPRDGSYELAAGHLLARHERQQRSRAAITESWNGDTWIHAVVGSSGRRPAAERAQLRLDLTNARLAELREGVWLRPDNLGDRLGEPSTSGLTWFMSSPIGSHTDLAARLWDLDAWATAARRLIDDMDRLDSPLASGDHRVLADGFVTSADVLRHFQADPLLPPALSPGDWPGDALRARYDAYDATYRSVLADWFRRQE